MIVKEYAYNADRQNINKESIDIFARHIVLIQAKLANKNVILLNGSNPEIHAKEIYKEYLKKGGCPYYEYHPYPSASPEFFQGYVSWCNKKDGLIILDDCNKTECDKCDECKA